MASGCGFWALYRMLNKSEIHIVNTTGLPEDAHEVVAGLKVKISHCSHLLNGKLVDSIRNIKIKVKYA